MVIFLTWISKIPSTHTEFRTAIQNYIQLLGLDAVYPKDRLAEIAKKAAKNIGPALKELGLPKESTLALTKVNLFDTWFYCGMSIAYPYGRCKNKDIIIGDQMIVDPCMVVDTKSCVKL